MVTYPKTIQKLIAEFTKFPNIGQKGAERFVFYLLEQPKETREKLIALLKELELKISLCPLCFNYVEKKPCPICNDSKRDHSTICLVSSPQELLAIEKTGEYKGVYFVLGGVVDPLKNRNLNKLRLKKLISRIEKSRPAIKEIVFAFNPDMAGETTILYLLKIFKKYKNKIKFTRLARGLPLGGSLEYADPVTLTNAIKERKKVL